MSFEKGLLSLRKKLAAEVREKIDSHITRLDAIRKRRDGIDLSKYEGDDLELMKKISCKLDSGINEYERVLDNLEIDYKKTYGDL